MTATGEAIQLKDALNGTERQLKEINKTPYASRLTFHLTLLRYSDRNEFKYVLFRALFVIVIDTIRFL